MNKNKYSFEPINIKIKDLKEYTDVAFIIDSPSFIRGATKIRKRYGIVKALKSNNYQHWLIANVGEDKIPLLYQEITDLRLSIGFEANYQDIFEKAVLGCNIEDNDYKATKLINFSKLPPSIKYDPTALWAILLSPQTIKEDITKAFNKYRKILKNMQQAPDTYSLVDEYNKRRGEIERDRKWFWEKEQRMTYWQIAKKEGISRDRFVISEKDLIAKAIKAYKNKLY